MHDMWQTGVCARGHTLTLEDHEHGRCMACKRGANARLARERRNALYVYTDPEVVDDRWFERAICCGIPDPDKVFFPERGDRAFEAKRICANCPLAVRRDCLASALLDDPEADFGHRAGLSPKSRMEIRQGRRSFEESLGITDDPVVSRPAPKARVA